MDFVMEHIGVFIGAFVIILLAVIGYFADKKDNEERNKDNGKINDDNVVNNAVGDSSIDASPIEFNELPDVSSNVGINELDGFDEKPVTYSFDQTLNDAINNAVGNDKIVSDIPEEDVIEIDDTTVDTDVQTSNENANGSFEFPSELFDNSDDSNDLVDSEQIPSELFDNNENVQVSNELPINENILNESSDNSTISQNEFIDGNGVQELINANNDMQIHDDAISNDDLNFNFSNFEDTNVSLEDLERRNYENIIKGNNELNDDNFYYSDIDEDVSFDSNSLMNNSGYSTGSQSVEQESSINDIQSDVASNLNSDEVTDNNSEVSKLDDEHQFDGEVVESQDESSQVDSGSSEAIPDVNNDGASFESNSTPTFDDIWKF